MHLDSAIEIVPGLPEEHRASAAQLYYTAFRQKLSPIFRSDEDAIAVLEEALNSNFGITALYEGEFAGVAGIQYGGGHFVDISPAIMTRRFGRLRGWLKLIPLALMARPQREGQLLMDGIVVAPEMRGKGIGTRLLQAVMTFARDHGFREVRLDVVDTN
ncbi:MAG: GNAT family N-acetyltransferase, partial [Anaerolineae bacterium]|nr:GNAT family N-acetyltransferase [Anaerolineae bacterium]